MSKDALARKATLRVCPVARWPVVRCALRDERGNYYEGEYGPEARESETSGFNVLGGRFSDCLSYPAR